jgi:F0F1-type ATP synthase assembly protein I
MGVGNIEKPLKSLEAKIKAAKKAADPVEQVQNKFSAAEVGWRMIIELTAGVFIGFGVGYGLDFLFDFKTGFYLDNDPVWVCSWRENYDEICS